MGYDMSWRYETEELARARREAFPNDGEPLDSDAIMGWHSKRQEVGAYFRLNIWGMGEYREAMYERGMLDVERDSPPYPRYADFGVSEQEYEDWDGEREVIDLNASEAFKRWRAAVDNWVAEDVGGLMPAYKFGSNDGWVVTPEEITRSLTAYESWLRKQREANGDNWSDPMDASEREADGSSYWSKWLRFLYVARSHGGVVVN